MFFLIFYDKIHLASQNFQKVLKDSRISSLKAAKNPYCHGDCDLWPFFSIPQDERQSRKSVYVATISPLANTNFE